MFNLADVPALPEPEFLAEYLVELEDNAPNSPGQPRAAIPQEVATAVTPVTPVTTAADQHHIVLLQQMQQQMFQMQQFQLQQVMRFQVPALPSGATPSGATSSGVTPSGAKLPSLFGRTGAARSIIFPPNSPASSASFNEDEGKL